MKNIRKIVVLLLLLLAALHLLTGCSTVETEVPDSVVYDLVNENEYASLGDAQISLIHHFDEKTHRDSVDVFLGIYAPYAEISFTCSAVYEYDRSSDLWSLVQYDGWSEPDFNYAYTDSLIKTWQIDNYGSTYEIKVTDVYPMQISVEFLVNESIHAGLDGDYTWKVSGYGTFDMDNGYFEIPLDLPEECYVSWKDTQSGENESVTYLCVWLSPESGITYATISPDIQVW